ncbi:MAG TPA: ABC transporter permease, partial [Candidatus Bathyarchaeota archaeon]|nr:ABC transporter permease [Candidatus Bathyarchaeota archaeon]
MRQSLARAWAIAKKDIRIYYLKGLVVIFGLLLPLFLYLAYAMGRSMAPKEAISSIMTMTVFFTSTAVGPVIAPW